MKSDRSLCPITKMFFGDKGNESDSSAEDADSAVIAYVVNGSSSETPVIPRECPSQPSRLVVFIYAEQRRDGQGRRSELEYVRQLEALKRIFGVCPMRIRDHAYAFS